MKARHVDSSQKRGGLRPRVGAALAALVLVGCHPSAPAQKDGRWATFNGFYPGMTMEEAKAAGAGDCKELELGAKGIGCKIPAERLALGDLVASSGRLEFHAGHELRLSRMYIHFRGTHYDRVCQALAKVYGTPVSGIVYAWHRDGTPAQIRSNTRALAGDPGRSLVEFQFEPEYATAAYDGSISSPRGCMDVD